MRKSEIIKILTYISTSYGKLFEYPTTDSDKNDSIETMWYDTLRQFTIDEALRAVKMIKYDGGQYPPHDGMVFKKILETKDEGRMSGVEAFERAIALVKVRGSLYLKYPSGTSESEKFRMKDDIIMQNESETFKRAVMSFGGLNGVTDDINNSFVKNQFIKTFETMQDSQREREVQHLTGGSQGERITGSEETVQIEAGIKALGSLLRERSG